MESCLTHLDPWEQAAIIQVSHCTDYQKLLIGNNQNADSQFIWKHCEIPQRIPLCIPGRRYCNGSNMSGLSKCTPMLNMFLRKLIIYLLKNIPVCNSFFVL